MHYITRYPPVREKEDDMHDQVPIVEGGEAYANPSVNDIDIAQNSYPHVPQLV